MICEVGVGSTRLQPLNRECFIFLEAGLYSPLQKGGLYSTLSIPLFPAAEGGGSFLSLALHASNGSYRWLSDLQLSREEQC